LFVNKQASYRHDASLSFGHGFQNRRVIHDPEKEGYCSTGSQIGWMVSPAITFLANGMESTSEAFTVALCPRPAYKWPSTTEPAAQASRIRANWLTAAGVTSDAPVPIKT